jgi:peptidylglycine monooxygenase
MARETLFVTLGDIRYRIERPWGDLPPCGRVTDVACDSRGHVFALLRSDGYVDPDGPAVVELDPSGRRIAAWGGDVIADGHMIAIGSDDRIYVIDRDAHEIVVFDTTGKPVGSIGERHRPGQPFCHPCDVAVAASGDIYVADGYGASHVHHFSADGRLLSTWGTPGSDPGQFTTPHAVCVLADGRVAVADRENNRIQLFSADGKFLDLWHDFYKPMDIFLDSLGRILVTDQVPRLSAVSDHGALVGRCRPVLNGAHGLTGDGTGHIYLAEGTPSRISRMVPDVR